MISFITILLSTSLWASDLAKPKEQLDPCKVFGKFYIVDSPYYAHFRVYEEDSEAFSDIIVFEEESVLYADREGHWSFVDKREFADIYIYFEEEKNMADFSIYFTEFESFAGCNR